MTKTRWDANDSKRLALLMKAGENARFISEVMHKPYSSVRHQMRWSKLNKQERTDRSRIAREKRLKRDLAKSAQDYRTYSSRNPTPEMIADRDFVYYEAPRTITAIMFGDPGPGRSALDQRA